MTSLHIQIRKRGIDCVTETVEFLAQSRVVAVGVVEVAVNEELLHHQLVGESLAECQSCCNARPRLGVSLGIWD